VVAETNFLGQIVRHLQKLKRQLERNDVTAILDTPGGSRVTLHVPGIEGPITCRSNPADAHHPWYWHNNEPLTPAADTTQAREAAIKILELLAEAAEHRAGPEPVTQAPQAPDHAGNRVRPLSA
jgi:hypothetical protein